MSAPRCPRYRSLDIWRGAACLFVVLYHSAGNRLLTDTSVTSSADMVAAPIVQTLQQLWIGVPMFFVISGYCIAATADSSRRKGGGIRAYFTRRARRIFPPWVATVMLSVALIGVADYLVWPGIFSSSGEFIPRPWWLTLHQWAGNLSLTESWRWHFGDQRAYFLGHAWSLCYEEQFYAVTGLVLFVAPKSFFRGMLLVTVACVSLATLCAALAVRCDGFFFDGHWHLFAAGIAVYYARNYAGRKASVALGGSLLVALALSAVAAYSGIPIIRAAGGHAAAKPIIGFTFALILLALSNYDIPLAAAPVLRPLATCGTMCYSIYLVHYPVVHLLRELLERSGFDKPAPRLAVVVPICTLASLACAWIFFHAIEKRFLNSSQPAKMVLASGL